MRPGVKAGFWLRDVDGRLIVSGTVRLPADALQSPAGAYEAAQRFGHAVELAMLEEIDRQAADVALLQAELDEGASGMQAALGRSANTLRRDLRARP